MMSAIRSWNGSSFWPFRPAISTNFLNGRVAGLLQRIEEGYIDAGPDALTAQQERELIALETHEFVQEQYDSWNNKLMPALAKENIRVL